jgi:hypothetical protein
VWVHSVQDNVTLLDLNLASNGVAGESTMALSALLKDPQHRITNVNLSSNLLTEQDIRVLRTAIERNKSLIGLDLRRNPGADDGMPAPELGCKHIAYFSINRSGRADQRDRWHHEQQ